MAASRALGSFGAYLLHLGYVEKKFFRRILGLQAFHVKHIRVLAFANKHEII